MDSDYVIWALKFLFFDTVYGISFPLIIDIVFLLSGKRELSGGWIVWSFIERFKKHRRYVCLCSAGTLFMLFFSAERAAFYAICGFTTCQTKAVSWNLYDSVGAF